MELEQVFHSRLMATGHFALYDGLAIKWSIDTTNDNPIRTRPITYEDLSIFTVLEK